MLVRHLQGTNNESDERDVIHSITIYGLVPDYVVS